MTSQQPWPKRFCTECGAQQKFPDRCMVCGSTYCDKCWRKHAQYQEVGVALIHEIFTCPRCGARREFWYHHRQTQPKP